jgi:hypothetical protein
MPHLDKLSITYLGMASSIGKIAPSVFGTLRQLRVIFRGIQYAELINDILAYAGQLEELELFNTTWNSGITLLAAFKMPCKCTPRRLVFSERMNPQFVYEFLRFQCIQRNLVHLTLAVENYEIWNIIPRLPVLETLTILGHVLPERLDLNRLGQLPQLTHLRIEGHQSDLCAPVGNWVDACTVEFTSVASWLEFGHSCPSVHLTVSRPVDEVYLESDVSDVTTKWLVISVLPPDVDASGIVRLAAKMPNISSLTLMQCRPFFIGSTVVLDFVNYLHTLNIQAPVYTGAVKEISNTKQIVSLSVRECPGLANVVFHGNIVYS